MKEAEEGRKMYRVTESKHIGQRRNKRRRSRRGLGYTWGPAGTLAGGVKSQASPVLSPLISVFAGMSKNPSP